MSGAAPTERGGLDALLRKTSCAIDAATDRLGDAVSWLSLGMVLVTLLIIFMGLFDYGRIWIQDSVTYMHGILFMSAVGYTLLHEGHVRIDVFYGKLSPARRAMVNVFGSLFLLIPTLGLIFVYSWSYVWRSWAITEGAYDAGGLPGTYLYKTFILLFCVFGIAQGLSQLCKALLVVRGEEVEEEHGSDFA